MNKTNKTNKTDKMVKTTKTVENVIKPSKLKGMLEDETIDDEIEVMDNP